MSIDQALSGQVAGLSSIASSGAPGAAPKIRIRGTASLNGTQDPLWVLDGVPMTGTEIPTMERLESIYTIYISRLLRFESVRIIEQHYSFEWMLLQRLSTDARAAKRL